VDGTLAKVMAWYDNEWGFTHQMIREARSILGTSVHLTPLPIRPRSAAGASRTALRARRERGAVASSLNSGVVDRHREFDRSPTGER